MVCAVDGVLGSQLVAQKPVQREKPTKSLELFNNGLFLEKPFDALTWRARQVRVRFRSQSMLGVAYIPNPMGFVDLWGKRPKNL